MPKQWLSVDTRQLGQSRDSKFDGFLHIVPKAMAKIHHIDVKCWCEPRVAWDPDVDTVMVSHRDIRPHDPEKGKKKCPA